MTTNSSNSKPKFVEAMEEAIDPGKPLEGTRYLLKESSKSRPHNAMSIIDNPFYKVRSPKNMFLGEMLTFRYDPKGGEKLNYWDEVPLAILFDINSTSMLCMNIHYMPKNIRKKFLEDVKKGKVQKRRAMGMMARLMRHPKSDFLWRRYLFERITSRVVGIKTDYWDYAASLPVQWGKGATNKIYADYRRYNP